MIPDGGCTIGPWRVSVDDGVLSRAGEERRLEDRARRTLAVLCRRRGEVVSRQDILEEVWNGRAVSANSVAIVIGDIRRALGEDARHPAYVETIAKRGYRLRLEPSPSLEPAVTPPSATPAGTARLPRRALVAGGLAGALGGALVLRRATAHGAVRIVCGPVQNDTGRPDLDRLARALGVLVDLRLARLPDVVLVKTNAALRDGLRFRARLILWNGEPTLSLEAMEPRTGAVVWAGMAEGPAPALAANTVAQIDSFTARLRGRRVEALPRR